MSLHFWTSRRSEDVTILHGQALDGKANNKQRSREYHECFCVLISEMEWSRTEWYEAGMLSDVLAWRAQGGNEIAYSYNKAESVQWNWTDTFLLLAGINLVFDVVKILFFNLLFFLILFSVIYIWNWHLWRKNTPPFMKFLLKQFTSWWQKA